MEHLIQLGGVILDAAITVHKELGPGLLESAYELALERELQLRNLKVQRQVPMDLFYKGTFLGKSFVMDMLVENEVIVEIKSVDVMNTVFKSQVFTYLKLTKKQLGYVINFNVPLVKDGFRKVINAL